MKACITVKNSKFGKIIIVTNNDMLLALEFTQTECKEIPEHLHDLEDLFISKGFTVTYNNLNNELIDKIVYCLDHNTYDDSIKFNIIGTTFQKNVWQALCQVPTGSTVSYKKIAELIGNPKAVRAVGTACKNNPIAYFIPCHRILLANGDIGQYRWGVGIKRQLLDRENIANVAQRQEATV